MRRRQYRIARLADGQPTYRLLVVDDQPEGRQWISGVLERLGFQVREAADGQEAVQIWETWHPHLIWMDMRMPGMDGHEAIRQIKSTPEGWRTIIIALTASAFEGDRSQILAEGSDDFLLKPVGSQDLIDRLERHLGVVFVETGEVHEDLPLQLSEGDLAAVWKSLPEEWLADMRVVVGEADFSRAQVLVNEIRPQHAALADTLDMLINNFDVRGLLSMLPPPAPASEEEEQ